MDARSKIGWRWAVPVAAVLAGLMFATSANTSHGIDLRVNAHDDGVTFAEQQQRKVIDETRQLAELQAQVRKATSDAAKVDSRVARARDEAAAVADAAGMRPVSGPAITVTLNDAPPLPGSRKGSVPPDYLVVHQQDVQAVVNALWAGGAEAMTLQGQRVISTSAVRCVGNTLLLHGVVYSPPYVVTAIGNIAAMSAALDAAPDVQIYKQYVRAYKLGYSVKVHDRVTMPAFTGGVSLPHVTALPPSSQPALAPPRTPSAPVATPSAATAGTSTPGTSTPTAAP